jgi:hypothetical protein
VTPRRNVANVVCGFKPHNLAGNEARDGSDDEPAGDRPTRRPAHGEFESERPGYCGAQDTFYVGTLKGVGRVYQQTFIDTSQGRLRQAL